MIDILSQSQDCKLIIYSMVTFMLYSKWTADKAYSRLTVRGCKHGCSGISSISLYRIVKLNEIETVAIGLAM